MQMYINPSLTYNYSKLYLSKIRLLKIEILQIIFCLGISNSVVCCHSKTVKKIENNKKYNFSKNVVTLFLWYWSAGAKRLLLMSLQNHILSRYLKLYKRNMFRNVCVYWNNEWFTLNGSPRFYLLRITVYRYSFNWI